MIDLCKIKNMDRYKNFTMTPNDFPNGVKFCELFEDDDFDLVQIHDATPCGNGDIVGFSGAFHWRNNELISADGDSYTPNMKVLGYEMFEINDDECPDYHTGLDILVEEW